MIGEAPPAAAGDRPAYATRVLPPDEWEKLRALPFASNGLPDPETTVIFVDETAAGQIIGVWGIFLQPMLDGLWSDPEHRGTLVAGRLLAAMKAFLQAQGITYAFTVISDPQVMILAHKAGFTRAPGDLWMLQVAPPAPEGSV